MAAPTCRSESAVTQVKAQRLNEDHMGEMLCDQDASRLGNRQFLPHPVKRPAECHAIGLTVQMDERRQQAKQHLRMRAGKLEMAAEHRDLAAAVQLDHRAFGGADKMRPVILGWQARIAGNLERQTVRQQETVAFLEEHRRVWAFDRDPAAACSQGVAFDPCVISVEADRPGATRLKAADAVAYWLQQREDIG